MVLCLYVLKMLVCYYVFKWYSVVLERVADGEVDSVGFLEAGDVEIARLPGVVREVEGDAPVETDDEEAEVVSQADARAQRQIVEEFGELELHLVEEDLFAFILLFRRDVMTILIIASGIFIYGNELVAIQSPYVACIEEAGAFEVAEEGCSVFEVGY